MLEKAQELGAKVVAMYDSNGYIYDKETGREWKFGDEPGKRCLEMYNKLQDIQYGRCDDPYGWTLVVE